MRGKGQRRRRRGPRATGTRESALLLLLHRQPAHGYTLLEQLQEFGLGGIAPSVIYRVLRDMEAREWVASKWYEEQTQEPPRRIYRITARGDEVLVT
jgi:DNA-binding PadR family transcriptional regulator